MNILHTAHSKAPGAKQGEAKNSLLNSVGKNANMNSKSISQLQQDPKYKNINFDNVLAAARKGHDPEAMANLLVKEQNARDVAKENEPMLPFQKPLKDKQVAVKGEKLVKQVGAEKQPIKLNQLVAENTPKQTKSILAPMREREALSKTGQQLTPQEPQIKRPMAKTPVAKQAAKAQYQNASQVAEGTAVKRSSIFATPRVLDIQSKSQFANENRMLTSNLNQQRPMANTQLAQQQAVPVQVGNQFNTTNNVLELNQMRAKRNVNMPAYKSAQKRMIQAQPEMATQIASKTMKPNMMNEEVSFQTETHNMDMGDQAQRFAQVTPASMMIDSSAPTAKVLNMNTVQLSGNTDAVINQIQDYVVQTQAANQTEVAVSFEHQELGQVDLLVQKLDPKSEQLSIQIATRGNEAADFFKTHQGELINTLNRSGLQIADLKLDSASGNTQQELAQDSSSKDQMFGKGQKQHNSESGQRDADQNRRRELWDQFYENKDAA